MTLELDLDGARGWFAAVLAQHGAILEIQDGGGLFACLPPALQQRLALPEAALLRIAAPPGAEEVGVPLEGAAVQACLELAASAGSLAAARVVAPPCRPERAQAIVAQTLQVDNAAVQIGEVRQQPMRWLVLEFAWAAAADERDSGNTFVAVEPALHLRSAAMAATLLGQLSAGEPSAARPTTADVAAAMTTAWPLARELVEAAIVPFCAGAATRLRREQARLSAYHGKLLDEAQRRRGRGTDATIATKVAAIVRDRDEKQHELRQRFAVRVDVTVPSALAVEHQAVAVGVVVRRRTKERVVWVGIDPWARTGLERGCEACGTPGRVWRACDDAVHLLCGGCWGRRCLVCARGGEGWKP